jgi:hypothetical protein
MYSQFSYEQTLIGMLPEDRETRIRMVIEE